MQFHLTHGLGLTSQRTPIIREVTEVKGVVDEKDIIKVTLKKKTATKT